MQKMTWVKFRDTVLPKAERIEIRVPPSGSFLAFTTAVHADAPPILKWDHEDERNPVAWYVYPGGSRAKDWGLPAGEWVKVLAAVPLPTMWGSRPSPFLAEGVTLVIDGAADSRKAGNALFPECLKDFLHPVRATVEAHSRQADLGPPAGGACGYDLRKGNNAINCVLRVASGGGTALYEIDRWD